MPSATDFLPSSMMLFMNFDSTTSPNFGSGRISRFSGRRRRDIYLILLLFSLVRNPSGAYFFTFPGEGRDPGYRPSPGLYAGLRPLGHFGRLAPYLKRLWRRSLTPWVSRTPRSTW